jgi:penicillin-binding protein 2
MRLAHPNEKWSAAYTANVSIGQGYDLATPLQMAMAYSTVANGGISYYPRLVNQVLNQDGTPVLNADGKVAVPPTPKLHADFRNEFTPDQIELVRRGLWRVVNEDGGTGSSARMEQVVVAGKTGTAQAMLNGKKDTIAWFCCFAPFDKPRYTVVVMVQGGEHGGSVAAPIADRILERVFEMDAGKFEPQLAWLTPARKPRPFDMIKAVRFTDASGTPGADEENGQDPAQTVDSADMANPGDAPDVELEADARGRVKGVKKALRAQPVATPQPARPRSFFERMFNIRPRPAAPTATPAKKSRQAF